MHEFSQSVEFWQIAAAVVTVAGGLAILLPKALKFILTPIGIWLKTWFLMPHIINEIRSQVYNNGGSSLKDGVDSMNKRIAVIEGTLVAQSMWESCAKWWADDKGKTIAVNAAFQHLFKCSFSDVKEFNWVKLTPPEETDKIIQDWLRAVELKTEYVSEMHLVDAERNPLGLVDVHAIPIKTVGGDVYRYEGIIKPRSSPCPYDSPCHTTMCAYIQATKKNLKAEPDETK